jgi:hypothetical protein
LLVTYHAPNSLKEIRTVLLEELVKFELIDMYKPHCFLSTLNQFIWNLLEMRIVCFSSNDERKYTSDVLKVFFIEVWKLFLTQD